MRNAVLLVMIFLFFSAFIQAQEGGTQAVTKQIQPKIMVIPRVPDDHDMKAFYDTSINIQIALAKINEALQREGANLVSFDQVYKQAKQNILINRSSGNLEDFKSDVLQRSGADIYVEAKLSIVRHQGRGANSVTVILEGYQTGTGNMLGSKTGTSRINKTEDIGLLTMQAMDTVSVAFLSLMQLKFNDIHENGQSVYVEFSIHSDSQLTFDFEIGSQRKLLSEVIEDWFQEHAYKSVYNSQGVTSNKMIISDVRIPLKNPSNPRSNYTGQHLYSDILRFFRSLNVPIKREIGSNNKIIITIL